MKWMMACFLMVAWSSAESQQQYRCESDGVVTTGDWKPIYHAPHDGTLVEVLNAYGIAPTYGVFKFERGRWIAVDPEYEKHSGKGAGLGSEVCQWFRPFSGDLKLYVDPTHGAQWTTKYWCDAMHMSYSKKRDVCY